MPMFSYNFATRKLETEKFFKDYDKYVTNYDFVIDIDNPDFEQAQDDMMIVHTLFNSFQIAHEVVFSGNKGFHIEVRGLPYFEHDFQLSGCVNMFKELATAIKEIYRVESIDLSIYDQVRLWKIPYSIDTNTGLVVLPLKPSEIGFFSKEMAKPGHIIQDIKNRPDFIYTPGQARNIYKLWDEVKKVWPQQAEGLFSPVTKG
jgi:DNA primase catalytic subunit